MAKLNNIYLVICFLVLNCSLLYGQTDNSEGRQIDFVYQNFSKGYLNLDPIFVGECYADNAVVISLYTGKSPKIFDGKKAIIADFTAFFTRLKQENKKVTIDFLISKRTITKKKASDVGFYRLVSTDSTGKSKTSYGKIAIVLVKDKSNKWKFLTDTNSSSDESEYLQAKILSAGSLQTPLASRVDSLFTAYLDSSLAGSVIVLEKSIVTLQKAYGYANNDSKKLNTVNTLFNVASIGKQFTVYAILNLEREGRLKTSDYLTKYVGSFGDIRDSITIQNLLIHRSGIAKSGVELDYSTRDKFIQSVKTVEADGFAPGKGYRYSNAGFSMLAAVVEIVSGTSFEEYLYKNIFSPLKMNSTGYPWEKRVDKSLLATGYNSKRQPLPVQENIWAARGPGNIVTTMEDLSKWIMAYKNDNFLPNELKNKILANYYAGEESYGWTKTVTKRNSTFLHKGGGRPDFESRLMWFPDDDVVIIFSLNNDYNLARQLFSKISNFLN
jgi:CubicO group peptidase (beta-lactamase class C family)/ketosteroid isomerase-like protein